MKLLENVVLASDTKKSLKYALRRADPACVFGEGAVPSRVPYLVLANCDISWQF